MAAFVSYSVAVHVVCAVHTRSLVAVGAVVSNSAATHVVCATQTRSAVRLGALVSYSLAAHRLCVVQVPELIVVENEPDQHCTQIRSAMAVGLDTTQSPAGHVCQSVQAAFACIALKVSAGQGAHPRSLERVATTLRYSPAGQSADTAWHEPWSALFVKVPVAQAVQPRGTLVVGAVLTYFPAAQVV